jgi:hypothetical protein
VSIPTVSVLASGARTGELAKASSATAPGVAEEGFITRRAIDHTFQTVVGPRSFVRRLEGIGSTDTDSSGINREYCRSKAFISERFAKTFTHKFRIRASDIMVDEAACCGKLGKPTGYDVVY